MRVRAVGGLVAVVVVLGTVAPGQAGILYDNGPPDLLEGRGSDPDVPEQAADDFVLPAGGVVGGVRWYGAYFFSNTPTEPDAFVVRLFADAGGSPAVTPFFEQVVGDVGRTPTGQDLFGFDVYSYTASIGPVALAPGTTYWLSIVNDTSADADDNWAWLTSSPTGGNGQTRPGDGDPWSVDGQEQSFQLLSVPEPASLTLLAAGTGLVGYARRRRAA